MGELEGSQTDKCAIPWGPKSHPWRCGWGNIHVLLILKTISQNGRGTPAGKRDLNFT